MTFKQTQAGFEAGAADQLRANAYAAKLHAVATELVRQKYADDQQRCNSYVTTEIVKRFGVTETAARCVRYVLEQVFASDVVSGTYSAAQATVDVWNLLEKALDADTKFQFTEEPGEAFAEPLRLVKK